MVSSAAGWKFSITATGAQPLGSSDVLACEKAWCRTGIGDL